MQAGGKGKMGGSRVDGLGGKWVSLGVGVGGSTGWDGGRMGKG